MKTVILSLMLISGATLSAQDYIPFTFHNSSLKSIPLIIPGVMNPNLSPVSDSGVDLKIGQEIFFKTKGRKHLLFEVTEELRAADNSRVRLDIAELLRARKRELGLSGK